MTTTWLITMARSELEEALESCTNCEQAASIGKALGFLKIAEDQAERDEEAVRYAVKLLDERENARNTEGNHERDTDHDKTTLGVVHIPSDGD